MYRDLVEKIIQEQEELIGPLAWQEARHVPGLLIEPAQKKILSCPENANVVLNLIERFENQYGAALGQIAREAAHRLSLRLLLQEDTPGLIESILAKSHLSFKKDLSALDLADGLIIEITSAHGVVEQWLAKAILAQKPTLCLYRKNNEPRSLLTGLRQPGLPKNIVIKSFTPASLPTVLTRFLNKLSQLPLELATPSIKFTLRLTPDVDQYLEWRAKKDHESKADLLRQWLRERIAQDDSYKNIS